MAGYFLRRFLLVIPTFIGITLLVFVITRLVPGGPIERFLSASQQASAEFSVSSGLDQVAGSTLSEAQLQQLKVYYGFDKPIVLSYFVWLGKVLRFDLGVSTRYGESVWETIKQRLPVSVFYGLATLFLTYGICIPLGVLKAVRHASWLDGVSSILVFVGYAIPGYVVAVILLTVFGFFLDWFPLGGFVSDDFDDFSFGQKVWDVCFHAVLPLIAYVSGSFALLTFMMKNALMDNLAADFVRTAMAKGCSFKQAVWGHAFRNSFIPIATHIGENIGFFLAGSFLIETVFNIDGIGLLGFESLVQRDYPVMMGILVISALVYLVGNILSDLCVAWVDPRIRLGAKG